MSNDRSIRAAYARELGEIRSEWERRTWWGKIKSIPLDLFVIGLLVFAFPIVLIAEMGIRIKEVLPPTYKEGREVE